MALADSEKTQWDKEGGHRDGIIKFYAFKRGNSGRVSGRNFILRRVNQDDEDKDRRQKVDEQKKADNYRRITQNTANQPTHGSWFPGLQSARAKNKLQASRSIKLYGRIDRLRVATREGPFS